MRKRLIILEISRLLVNIYENINKKARFWGKNSQKRGLSYARADLNFYRILIKFQEILSFLIK
jgi:hypothetical protein